MVLSNFNQSPKFIYTFHRIYARMERIRNLLTTLQCDAYLFADDSVSETNGGIDATDNSCNNCVPQSIAIKEELSLSSASDDDVGPSIGLQKKSSGMHKGRRVYIHAQGSWMKLIVNSYRKWKWFVSNESQRFVSSSSLNLLKIKESLSIPDHFRIYKKCLSAGRIIWCQLNALNHRYNRWRI